MPAALKKRPALASPAPRSRRERRARAEPAIVRHFVMPGLEVGSATAKPRETVTAFLRRTGWAARDRQYGWQFKKGLPTILEINGEAVLRKQWTRRRIGANDNVRFVSYPLGGAGGGGAKQIIGLVALVAVSAFAIWAGPLVAGALGFGGSTLVGGLATAAIGLGGSGQQLPDGSGTSGGFFVSPTERTPGDWIGPFAANEPGTQAQSLAVDFVMPSGCVTFNQGSNGNTSLVLRPCRSRRSIA